MTTRCFDECCAAPVDGRGVMETVMYMYSSPNELYI